MNNIGKIIACRHQQRPFLRVVRAYFVDPAQDERASSKSDLTEPIYDLSTLDISVKRHLTENNAEDQLHSTSVHVLVKRTLAPDRSCTYADNGPCIDERPTSALKGAIGKPPPNEGHANEYADGYIRHWAVELVRIDPDGAQEDPR